MSQPTPSRPPRRANPGPGRRRIGVLVPDMRAPTFRRDAQQHAEAVAASGQAQDDQDFIDAVAAGNDRDRSRETMTLRRRQLRLPEPRDATTASMDIIPCSHR